MIINLSIGKKNPKRVLIIGSNSFIAKELIKLLFKKKINYLLFNRQNLNLLDLKSTLKIRKIIKPTDHIIFFSAEAPVKNLQMFMNNIRMVENFNICLKDIKFKQLIYLSSDAVYKDSDKKITEKSCAQPDSLHGLMHISREFILGQLNVSNYCIVRPTLIFGKNDPHNGYGPNSFKKISIETNKLTLFGKGEELRDHIHVDDVAVIIETLLSKCSRGIINAVSGKPVTFNYIANLCSKYINNKLKIKFKKRTIPMPHSGKRIFNNENINRLYPKYKFKSIADYYKELN